MLSLTFTSPGTSKLVQREVPTVSTETTLIAPRYVGLCGTDLELYLGSMPYFAQGVAAYPIQPGHEVAGVVVESGQDEFDPGTPVIVDPVVGCGTCSACQAGRENRCADRFELGLRRGMPGGAAEVVAVATRKLHPVPPGVGLRSAVLVEPGVTACNAVTRFGAVAARRALVIGGGTVGLIAAQLLVHDGAHVDILDIAAERRPLIEELDATPVTSAAADSYDLVVEASGAPQAVPDALAAVAPGGQVALIGVLEAPLEKLDVGSMVFKETTMFGVLNGPGLYDDLLTRIAGGSLNPEVLIDTEFPLAESAAALSRLCEPGRARPKVLLDIESKDGPR